jgi:hypothetical protein
MLSRGSEWHRWDLHIHSPASALNNQFPKLPNGDPDWESYISALETLGDIPAIAITDYFSIDGCGQELQSCATRALSGRKIDGNAKKNN